MPVNADRTPEQSSKRRAGCAERQQRILASAAHLFSERRFDEVLIDDVAQEAGVGKGTVYRYFSDKEELYFAVVFDGIAALRQQLDEATRGLDPLDRLRAGVQSIVSFLSRNRFFFRLMTREDSSQSSGKSDYRERWESERDDLVGSLAIILEDCAATGVLEVRYPRTDAQILLGMVRSTLRFNDNDLSADEAVGEILRVFLQGVKK